MLCRYLKQRKIEKSIADKYCYEVRFTNGSNDKLYIAKGFKIMQEDINYAMNISKEVVLQSTLLTRITGQIR